MASKSQRRLMKDKRRHVKYTSPDDTAKFLQKIDNVAKATRNSARKRKLMEDGNGTS
jgi:hypothetical protein